MSLSKKYTCSCFVIVCLLFSCVLTVDTKVMALFKNCTNDTIYIGASHYADIDSVDEQVQALYAPVGNSDFDTTNIRLWEGIDFHSDGFVLPDSMCAIGADYLFRQSDTCYLFLIKLADAKKYSLKEIRTNKTYHMWMVTRNKKAINGKNIRYLNTEEYEKSKD